VLIIELNQLKLFLLVETVAEDIHNFLLKHDENSLKDILVEDMRRIIPKLFQYFLDHDVTACRKGLDLIEFLLYCIFIEY